MPRPFPLLLVLALAAHDARADDVHRCVDAQGRAIYTDRPCESHQAIPRAAPGDVAVAEFKGGFTAPDCARTPAALRDGVRDALAAGDANRLAGYYHWAGTSTRGGRHLMDELEAITARPLVGIGWWPPREGSTEPDRPPMPSPATGPGAPPADPPPSATPEAWPAPPTRPDVPSGPSMARLPPGPWPALRIEQAGGVGDATAHRTDFRLVRHAGCWWIEL